LTESIRRIRFIRSHYPWSLEQRALDVGCGGFAHLVKFPAGSIGLDGRDLDPPAGFHFVRWNFDLDISDTLSAAGHPPRSRVIWCSDVLEHAPSPHVFLLNLRRALAEDGVLFLGVPLVNPLAFPRLQTRTNVFNAFCGFLSQDHVNFFTFKTLRHTVQFAGFELDGWYSPFINLRRPWVTGLEPVTVLALKRVPDWNYGPKAYKELDARGYLSWKSHVA
jgi:SAM-dependent methyltransferase